MSNQDHQFYQSVTNLIRQNNYDNAINELESFLKQNKNDETAMSIYSSALMRKGEEKRAIDVLHQIIAIYPESYAAHADLAFTSMKLGNNEQAIDSFEKAKNLKPDFYQAWVFLGKLYFDEKKYKDAVNAVEEAEKYDPFDQDYKRMQQAMQEQKPNIAEQIARDILRKQPGHPRAGFMLAHLASTVEAHEERADILRHCLEYHPANMILRNELVTAYEAIGDYELARDEAAILVQTDDNYKNYWVQSRIFGHLGDHENALIAAEKTAEKVKDDVDELGKVDLMLGHAYRVLGRRKESEEAYKNCLKNTPYNGAGWWGLADLKTYKFSEEDKMEMKRLIASEEIDPAQRCQVAFALAKAYESEGKIKETIDQYKIANGMRPNIDYKPEYNDQFCNRHLKAYEKNTLKKQAAPQPAGATPIFIVGMPRAGSTLIEQILSSHSKIEGTMELSTLPKLERKIKIFGGKKYKEHFPEVVEKFDETELANFGQEYIEKTKPYRTNKEFFIDKMPPNFERVGLIHKIMPQAIIIDARRHPLDCSYSAFKQHFAGGHEYSYDLENIGKYYNNYLKFMDHWDNVLPGKVICIQYEEMVRNTEATVRKLLDHIGVDFEEGCLEFYKNKRAVKTASSEQVRQPIYTKGMGQWMPVKDELGQLFDSLGEETLKRFEQFLPENN
ncbi:tetratricopeptide repeat-containing sulfotransferase family protein [Pseudemcibacter aquimaris]|uniref:tetratricopeptide repeat-containing sulfotransferase family protein n=1 Tax=Pseudemcibacter aquimaris TaxID=2857064 RepID=UPI002011F0E8|nr:tetratricopeptide repeat-containing sulfotransferase family protein [Pseudemcibacter aquimaris]MCC3862038.1 sulfotransferase [Pseudemcibacter aquimaris]WDU58790.1 sulfotransferase [Pseudemcibacter aquimaris]